MTEPTPTRKKRRLAFTRRSAAIVVALFMIAAPAGASVIVQNFMEAEITAAAPCFSKVGGDDTNDVLSPEDLADFDGANTATVDGVNVIEEKIDLTGMVGDRVIYTDVVRYRNTCGTPITVQLVADSISGTWDHVSAEIWISNVANPADVDPNVDVAADHWNNDQILVDASFVSDSTGAVVVNSGAEIQGAFVVTSDVDLVAGDAPVVNWVAQATIS